MGDEVAGDGGVAEASFVAAEVRAAANRAVLPVVAARVLSPADGQAQTAKLGGRRGAVRHDVREDHVDGLVVMEPLAIVAGEVPADVYDRQEDQDSGNDQRRNRRPGPE